MAEKEYIERDEAKRVMKENNWLNPAMPNVVNVILDRLPAADVVEVVRCKDCKYLYCLSAVDRRFYCRHFPQGLKGINIVEDNPFCSYGERKEETT